MNTLTITIGVSILIYILVSSYAGRSIKKLDDYFVAGRQAPTLLILGTLVASVMSTSSRSPSGVSGTAFQSRSISSRAAW